MGEGHKFPKVPEELVATKVAAVTTKLPEVTTKYESDDKTHEMIRKAGRPRKYADSKERHAVYNRKRRA